MLVLHYLKPANRIVFIISITIGVLGLIWIIGVSNFYPGSRKELLNLATYGIFCLIQIPIVFFFIPRFKPAGVLRISESGIQQIENKKTVLSILKKDIKWLEYNFREYEHISNNPWLHYPGKRDYISGERNSISFYHDGKQLKFKIKFSSKISLDIAEQFLLNY